MRQLLRSLSLILAAKMLVMSAAGQQGRTLKVLLVSDPSDPVRQAALKKALNDAGFETQVASSLPDAAWGGEVIVLDSMKSASVGAARFLREFANRGGGVVLTGFVPWHLSGKSFGSGYHGELTFRHDPSIAAISDWFGCSSFIGRQWHNAPTDVPVEVSSILFAANGAVAREAMFAPNEKISVWQEPHFLPILDIARMSSKAEVQALWQAKIGGKGFQNPFQFGIASEHPGNLVRGAAAFTHQYLKGRVYWQGWVEPNDERVMRLFLTGVAWAAKIGASPPAKIEPFPPSIAEELAERLAQGLRQRKAAQRPVAIFGFRAVGIDPQELKQVQTVIGEPLQEDLTSAFINAGIQTVERAQLERAIREIELSEAGLTDERLALQLGKLLPGSLLLIGSISPRAGGRWVVNARVLETQRGEAILAGLVEWSRGEQEGRGISALPVQVALDVAYALAEKLKARQEKRPLAVLEFRIVGVGEVEAKRLSVGIAKPFQEDLITGFLQQGLAVVERSQLEEAVKEIQLSEGGLTDAELPLKLGKFLPGMLIVVGSISPRGEGRWVINARVLETERGAGIAALIHSFEAK